MDLQSGGAISYLSEASTNYNLVNIRDKGRYIQQSYYSGQDLNRIPNGQHPSWSPWPWNPIQAGDVYDHSPQILDYYETPTELYVKSIPMLWDMNNHPAESIFETWVTVENNVVHVKNRVTINRTDNIWTQIIPKHQELPAVYTIGDLKNLYTYIGSQPFHNQPLTKITNSGPPWTYWSTYENWSAHVNDSNWGVGVLSKTCNLFVGGFSGSFGGGATSVSTSYMSPLITLALKKNDVFEYEYDLILGILNQIRDYVYANNKLNQTTNWEFNRVDNFEGWEMASGVSQLVANGTTLETKITDEDPFIYNLNTLIDPLEYTRVALRLKNNTNHNNLELFWQNDNGSLSPLRSASLTTSGNNGNFEEYIFDLSNNVNWTNGGLISGLRIDPPGYGVVPQSVEIDYIRLLSDNCLSENPIITGAEILNKLSNSSYSVPLSGGTWSSSNTNIATVDHAGNVSALSSGIFTLMYQSANGCLASKIIEVLDKCYLPATPSTIGNPALLSSVGISSLNRNTDNDDWVKEKKGAHLVLESKTKGLVISRMTTLQIQNIPTNQLVLGMAVFDVNLDCLKIYDGTTWKCYNTPACP